MAHEDSEGRMINHSFKSEIDDLVKLVECYRQRTFDEDIVELRTKFEGNDGL
jgi:hypothetical protein